MVTPNKKIIKHIKSQFVVLNKLKVQIESLQSEESFDKTILISNLAKALDSLSKDSYKIYKIIAESEGR
jgi:hypothetical protein